MDKFSRILLKISLLRRSSAKMLRSGALVPVFPHGVATCGRGSSDAGLGDISGLDLSDTLRRVSPDDAPKPDPTAPGLNRSVVSLSREKDRCLGVVRVAARRRFPLPPVGEVRATRDDAEGGVGSAGLVVMEGTRCEGDAGDSQGVRRCRGGGSKAIPTIGGEEGPDNTNHKLIVI